MSSEINSSGMDDYIQWLMTIFWYNGLLIHNLVKILRKIYFLISIKSQRLRLMGRSYPIHTMYIILCSAGIGEKKRVNKVARFYGKKTI